MNTIGLGLKEYIILSLGGRVAREVEVSDDAILGFGLPTARSADPEGLINDALAFSLITKDKVLPTELRDIVDQFVREHKGSSHAQDTISPRVIISVHHIEGLKNVVINRIHRKLNIAILNT